MARAKSRLSLIKREKLCGAASNSIQVNPTTGERAMKMTDQAAIATGVGILSGVAMGAGQLLQAGTIASSTATALTAGSTAAGIATSGIQYDENGVSQGWKFSDSVVQSMAVSGISQALGAGAAGKITTGGFAALSAGVGTGVDVGVQYYKKQHGQKNYYNDLRNPDLGRLGSMIGTAIEAGGPGSKEPWKPHNTNDALNVGYGGAILERLRRMGKGFVQGALKKMGLNEGGFFEKLGNFMSGFGFQSSAAIQEAYLQAMMGAGDDAARAMVAAQMKQAGVSDKTIAGAMQHSAGTQVLAKFMSQEQDIKDAIYELRFAAGRDGRLNNAAEGRALYSAIEDDIKSLARNGKVTKADFMKIGEKYNIAPKYLFDSAGNKKGADYLRGIDIQQMNDARSANLNDDKIWQQVIYNQLFEPLYRDPDYGPKIVLNYNQPQVLSGEKYNQNPTFWDRLDDASIALDEMTAIGRYKNSPREAGPLWGLQLLAGYAYEGIHYISLPIRMLFESVGAAPERRYGGQVHQREVETEHLMADTALAFSGAYQAAYRIAPVTVGGTVGNRGMAVVKNGIEDLSLITEQRAAHILYGDATGGGHKWGLTRLFNGKSKFPMSWSDQKILNTISDVATDPTLKPVWTKGTPGSLYTKSRLTSRYYVEGIREGVKIRSVYEPATGSIITGFPIR